MATSPTLLDVARTLRCASTDIARFVLDLAVLPTDALPSTTTEAGLRVIQRKFGRALDRLGVGLEVLHAERVPPTGGLTLMWNQETHLDHLVLATAIPRPFFSLFNNAVARTPFYGAHMRASGHFHVDRTDERQWRESVARAAGRIRDGACVLVSPEGTRSRDGRLLPMKRGAFLMAVASQRPIVCTTVIGGHARMPRGSPIVRAGPLRVVFSDAIPTEGHREDDLAALQRAVVETFEDTRRRFAIS